MISPWFLSHGGGGGSENIWQFDVLIFDTMFVFLPKNLSVATVRRSALPSLSVDASTCLSFFFWKKSSDLKLGISLWRQGCWIRVVLGRWHGVLKHWGGSWGKCILGCDRCFEIFCYQVPVGLLRPFGVYAGIIYFEEIPRCFFVSLPS